MFKALGTSLEARFATSDFQSDLDLVCLLESSIFGLLHHSTLSSSSSKEFFA